MAAKLHAFKLNLTPKRRTPEQVQENFIDPATAVIKEKKEEIQKKLAEHGIVIDVVKTGFGSSTTGNMARKFFAQYQLASQITGISADIE